MTFFHFNRMIKLAFYIFNYFFKKEMLEMPMRY